VPETRVAVGGRLHFGFGNLSLEHGRLYGALGEPRTVVTAEPAAEPTVEAAPGVEGATADAAREYARRAAERLGDGATVRVERALPRHAGLGSGTALALSVLRAVAGANGRAVRPRDHAAALGRGGRSGVGVAAFEAGGFVLDAGHPTARFTSDPPPDGEWEVPAVVARHPIPGRWRFLLVVPDAAPGRSAAAEDASMRRTIERADPERADRIAGVLTRGVLPAIAEGERERFAEAVSRVGRLNGAWYADEQGGLYRPPVGRIVDDLSRSPAVDGAGQSSWGPTVYGITDVDRREEALAAGEAALEAAGVDGDARVVAGRNAGATVESTGTEGRPGA